MTIKAIQMTQGQMDTFLEHLMIGPIKRSEWPVIHHLLWQSDEIERLSALKQENERLKLERDDLIKRLSRMCPELAPGECREAEITLKETQ